VDGSEQEVAILLQPLCITLAENSESMFGSLKKKKAGTEVIDKIWMTREAKWKGCIKELKSDPEIIFIAWFDETLQQLEEMLVKENLPTTNIIVARQVNSQILKNKKIVFVEHYPLSSKEQSFFDQFNITNVQIFSSLDEPLFKQFGSEKIVELMKQLGMKETESLEHKMISNAIKRAQDKIESKISFDQSARSQAEWFSKNLPD